MADHPVRRKLQRDILPYLLSARRLRKQWFCRLHILFGYTTDIVVALTAIGIGAPILNFLGNSPAHGATAQKLVSFSETVAGIPVWLYYPTAVFVIFWTVLRVAFTREDGQKRAVLAKSCSQVLRQVEARLHPALGKPDPMPDLAELLQKQITPTIDRNIQENVWPWNPFAPQLDEEITKELEILCQKYERDWQPIDSIDLRRVP